MAFNNQIMEIKKWKPVQYSCRIRKTFVTNVGFI